MSEPPAIELTGVSKAYRVYHGHGRGWLASRLLPWLDERRFAEINRALRDVELTIAPGEVVGIVGRNGSGKSTLLRVIAGITRPSTGDVRVRGQMRCVLASGVTFDPGLSGRENAIYGSIAMGVPRRAAEARLDAIFDMAELHEHADAPTRYYSRGMRARLALAVALQDAPEVLLLDEALSAGDAGFAERCRERLDELASSGRTVLVASHSMPFVRRTCTRALLMAEGRIAADGPPDAVTASYHATIVEHEARSRTEPLAPVDGQVTLEDAWMCGADGVRRTDFCHGERVELHLRLAAPEPVPNPRFRIELLESGTDTRVTETGSYHLNAAGELGRLDVDELAGDQELCVTWLRNPLGYGDFEWRVTVFSHERSKPRYHLRQAAVSAFTSTPFPDRSWRRRTLLETESEVSLVRARTRDPAA